MDAPSADSSGGSGVSLRVRLLLLGAVALAAASFFWRGGPAPAPQPAQVAAMPTRLQPQSLSQADAEREAPAVSEGYTREVVRPNPVQGAADEVSTPAETSSTSLRGSPEARRRDEKRTLPEIFLMPAESGSGATPAPTPAHPQRASPPGPALGDAFAPFGRLLKCQLVDTVDSVTARTEPIVALVTQDLDWNGSVIIPAGTEAFSYAKPEAIVDAVGVGRLVDSGEWTLVLPGDAVRQNGRELILKARAVDRRETVVTDRGGARSWALDDGADGLVGYTLSTLDNTEVKLFAAAAVSGMAQGIGAIAERQQAAAGLSGALGATQIAPTVGNAAVGSLSGGAVAALDEMVSRIREEVARRGAYVRVPAGKTFYLFVEQTIDPRAAAIGLRLPKEGPLPR